MAESYSVTAYLKAAGADQFANSFKNATKQVDGLERSTGNARISIKKMIGVAAGIAATVGVFRTLRGAVDQAFSRIDTMENFDRVMTEMTGSTQEAQKALDKTNSIVKGTAYGLDTAAKSVQNFVTRGIGVDKATGYIEAFGDAVAFYGDGSNEQLSSVSDALSKMVTKGTVEMDQLNRLFDVGIDAVGMYAKATGKDAASVQADLSAGEISAINFIDTVSTAMAEGTNGVTKIAGAAKNAGASWSGSFANMRAAVARGVTNIITNIDEMLTGNGLPDMRAIVANFGSRFESVLTSAAEAIPKIVSKIKEVKKAIEPWIPTLTTAAAVIGSVLIGFYSYGKAVAIIGAVTKVVNGLKKAQFGLNLVMSANPIGLIIAAIAALAAIFIYLWNTNEGFKQFFINAWNTIKETAISVWESIKTIIMPIVQEIVSFVMSIWSTLVVFWNEHGQMIIQAAQNVWSVVWNVIQTYATYIWSIIESVMNVIWDIMQAIWPAIQGIIKTTWNTIKGVIQGAIYVITGIIQFFSALFTGNWSALWDAVKKILSGALTIIKSVISGAFNLIKGIISAVFNAIKSIVSSVWNGIKDTISKVVNGIKDTVSNIFNSFKGIVSDAFSNVKNAVSDGINKALDIVNNIKDKFKEAGKNIIMSIVKGIKGQVDKVKDAISNVTQKIRDFLPFSPAKEGALRDIMKIQIGESIAKSIERSKGTVANAIGYKDGTTKEKAKKVGKILRLFPKREVIAI